MSDIVLIEIRSLEERSQKEAPLLIVAPLSSQGEAESWLTENGFTYNSRYKRWHGTNLLVAHKANGNEFFPRQPQGLSATIKLTHPPAGVKFMKK